MSKIRGLLVGAALIAISAVSAHAVPVQLYSDGTETKIKFENFENLINTNNNTLIDQGDKFYGILNVTSIGKTGSANALSGQLNAMDLFGVFQFTVASGSIPIGINNTGSLRFTMDATDYIEFYTGANNTFDISKTIPTLQTQGTLWASVLGSDFLYGDNNTTQNNQGFSSINKNLTNFTVNNTGYAFDYKTKFIDSLYTYQVDTTTNLTFNLPGQEVTKYWAYTSDDPMLLTAAPVPEPGTIMLLGAGLFGLCIFARRRNSK